MSCVRDTKSIVVVGTRIRVIYTGQVILSPITIIVIYSVHGSGAPVLIGPGKAVTSARCSNTTSARSSSLRDPFAHTTQKGVGQARSEAV